MVRIRRLQNSPIRFISTYGFMIMFLLFDVLVALPTDTITQEERCCIDLRRVIAVSEKYTYSLPQRSALQENMRKIPQSVFKFNIIVFIFTLSPSTFQIPLDPGIGPEIQPYAAAYLNDSVPNFLRTFTMSRERI
ncbi:hypothetical protein J6590_042312 [Homalodisca vitripennis]|nr:hypothetical protein J6590_042312 [Homalodisca vitripennis]